MLMKEKKTHFEENSKLRKQLKEVESENKNLQEKIKHLTKIVEDFKLSDDVSKNNDNKSSTLNTGFVQINTDESFLESPSSRRQSGFLPMMFKSERYVDEYYSDSEEENLMI